MSVFIVCTTSSARQEFLQTTRTAETNKEKLAQAFKEQLLLVAGFKRDEIEKMDLTSIDDEKLQETVRARPMRIRVPPKKIRERFLLVYELEGCQKAVNFLTEYYGVRKMKITLNGRRVGNGDIAVYFQNRAYFTKRGLNKRTTLHELYHHLVYANDLNMSQRMEERSANRYALDFLS